MSLFSTIFKSQIPFDEESLNLEQEIISPYDYVEQKFKKHIKRKFSPEEYKNAISNLSNVERLKEIYLNSAIINNKKKILSEKNQELQRNSINQKVDSELKVKLLITDLYHDDDVFKKGFREILSPLLSTVDIKPKYGIFHSALLIGEWLIEWNELELCIPKKLSAELALFVVDIGKISILNEVDQMIDEIAKIIVKWNTKYEYNMIPGKTKKNKGNCQEFVEDVLNAINIKPKFQGATALFLDKMKNQGKSEMVYETQNTELIKKFGFDKKVFTTHEELDKFMIELENKDIDFSSEYREDYELLKCFDRAFWLRFYQTKKKDFTPYSEQEKFCCPFGDPETTQSFFKK